MKKSDLRLVIREVVREEVKMELRKYLKEIKMKKINEVKKPKPTKKTIKNYTKNKKLNDLLNETANASDIETMGDGIFTTDSMSDIMSKAYNTRSETTDDSQMISSMGVNPQNVPDHVSGAITRDYSELMKAINKNK